MNNETEKKSIRDLAIEGCHDEVDYAYDVIDAPWQHRLLVFDNGELQWHAYATQNEWSVYRGTTIPVEVIFRIGGNCANSYYIDEDIPKDEGDEEGYEKYVKEEMVEAMMEAIEEIEIGYFEDEYCDEDDEDEDGDEDEDEDDEDDDDVR